MIVSPPDANSPSIGKNSPATTPAAPISCKVPVAVR